MLWRALRSVVVESWVDCCAADRTGAGEELAEYEE